MKEYIPHSTGCFICGQQNPVGLKHRFYAENGMLCSDVFIPSDYCGFKDVVHGGICTALLDETMGWSPFIFEETLDRLCFTRSLEVKFRKNTPTMTKLIVEAKYHGMHKGICEVTGELKDASGTVFASASGRFIPIPHEKMNETIQYLVMEEGVCYHEKCIKYLKDI